jgi:hypothetical protein
MTVAPAAIAGKRTDRRDRNQNMDEGKRRKEHDHRKREGRIKMSN